MSVIASAFQHSADARRDRPVCVLDAIGARDLNPSPLRANGLPSLPLKEHQRIAVRDLGGQGSSPKSLLNILADCPKPFDSRDAAEDYNNHSTSAPETRAD